MAICPTCGRSEPGKPRSPEHMRRYFAVMNVVWTTWPSSHPEQFESMDDMRRWIQMRAGHRETIRIDLGNADPVAAVILAEAAMKAAGAYARARVIGSELVVFKPKSIAFSKLSQHDFTKLNAEVEAVIEHETGIKITDAILTGAVDAPTQEEIDPDSDP